MKVPRYEPEKMTLRKAKPSDHKEIMDVMVSWWEGRDLRAMGPRLFLDHFCNTSFVIREQERLAAFLIGFLSPVRKAEGYIHFAGVHPICRNCGLGARLYHRFFDLCRAEGRRVVRSCTSPVNTGSIAFHRHMGFEPLAGDAEEGGIPIIQDYNRPGDPKVRFEIRLEKE